ncbi:copper resistance protein NlpE [Sphingobacterium faecale]|uniref:Copper resistance protein NlpE N-terminal domain-containing protein n=1 Tax=Sphingobacterium faecale TaxID=2803775 RepID=A0ABS1R9B1_9SPHI|nr:copper resistance protein NlpE [Sphingobacterium faecale]MBL1411298.1 copper resistance protein NlpE N-terminal domain-containing protein [Sphingobacterium faecale]
MRIFNYISIALIISSFFVGCINNKKRTTAKDKLENIELLAANVVGVYTGNLPCVDCDAITTLLELHRDHSYTLTYMYDGKSNEQFVKEGKWEIDKNKLILDGVDYKYKIESELLVQLDLSGNEITGDLAESYQLAKMK